jgi:F420-dependent oxidoreductase-like protein
MAREVRFGVTLPQIKRSWEEAGAAAREFDRLGFDSVWVCDHLYGVPLPHLPILEAWSLLAAVAAVTERVRLGTLVTPPFFRNPAVLAKQIATIDHISAGRAAPGFGAGWFEPEFRGYGARFPGLRQRLAALDEALEIMTRMWTEEKPTFEGEYFSVQEVMCEPRPARKPPVLVGGGGEKVLMGIAARRADVWNNMAVFQADLPRKIEALKRRCDEVGRDFDEIEISQQCVVVIGESHEAASKQLDKAVQIYGGHMGGSLKEHGIWGAPEAVIEKIERHRALGCTHFPIEFFGRDTREPARLFAETVMPAFA